MAQFSVKEAIVFSFSKYLKHFVLLTGAMLVLEVFPVAYLNVPRYVAQKLHIEHVLDATFTLRYDQPLVQTGQDIASQILTYSQSAPAHLLLLVWLVILLSGGLHFFLGLGFVNLGLTLVDKDRGSLKLLFQVSFAQTARFFGSLILLCGYLLVMLTSIVIAFIPLGRLGNAFFGGFITSMIAQGVGVCVGLWVLCCLLDSIFCADYLIDMPQLGALGSLMKSRALVRGFRLRIATTLTGLFFLTMAFLYVTFIAINPVINIFFGKKIIVFIRGIVISMTVWPLFSVCISYIYRALNPKQSA